MSVLAGIVARAAIDDALALEATSQGGSVLSYSETPISTGDRAPGSPCASARARYWFTSSISVFLEVGYVSSHRFRRDGRRVKFESDPPLVDVVVAEPPARRRLSFVAF